MMRVFCCAATGAAAGAYLLGDGGGVAGLAVAHTAQAVVGAVGHGDQLGIGVEGLQRQHRAKDFVLHDFAVLPQVSQHGRLEILRAKRVRLAAPQQLGTVSNGTRYKALHALDLARVDDGADLDGLVIPAKEIVDPLSGEQVTPERSVAV